MIQNDAFNKHPKKHRRFAILNQSVEDFTKERLKRTKALKHFKENILRKERSPPPRGSRKAEKKS